MAGAAAGFDTMQALFDNKKAPQNSALESTWSSQPELPPVVEDLQVTATVGKYAISRKLGEGEFATVFACRAGDDENAPELALKAINKAKVQRHSSILKSKRNIRRVNMEVLAMRRCRHAGICRIYDVLHSPSSVYLVMEMAERDLFTFLDGYPDGCPEPIIKQVMRILALGLRHCHNAGVAHRDVKPENILVVGEPHEWDAGRDKGDSTSLRREWSARARFGNSTHASRALREMIARPKISRNERKPAELGAFEVGKFAPLSCPGGTRRARPRASSRSATLASAPTSRCRRSSRTLWGRRASSRPSS